MMNTVKDTIQTRRIAFLAADGVDENDLNAMKNALTKAGAMVKVLAPRGGTREGRARWGSEGGYEPGERGLGPLRCHLHPGRREERGRP